MTRRIAVTGLGAVSALGLGAREAWQGVREGRCGIAPHATSEKYPSAIHSGAGSFL